MLKASKILLIFILLNFCSCDKLDTRELIVKNSSDKIIYSILSENDSMNDSGFYYEYQDNFNESKRGDYDAPFVFEEIMRGKMIANSDRPRYWDNYFQKLEDKKARLFIVEKDSVDKYGWKTIFAKNIYSKKYFITLEKLDSLNWQIEYKGGYLRESKRMNFL
ncbi:hypothetical protein [Flavobacterium defluvii]|uniref:Uncharacterized protein n=1 Tax=Flavobacterium defluvii TaxID=370979 RepID=A0A1M5FAZ2_9FLAO|nr:hypothetical protein [Flavobacterium defluvii]SHF88687.1 hypothetical protein SAMN05443663_101413 [Flavobacterium defluvii]